MNSWRSRARHAATDAIIRLAGVRKDYVLGVETVRALRGVDLHIARGEYVAIAAHARRVVVLRDGLIETDRLTAGRNLDTGAAEVA